MPNPRKTLISLDATPYYHCISRCVRRAFLCGKDSFTGKSFEHRRQLIESRMLTLSKIFSIDIAAYAIMSNHYHVVLHIDEQKALTWSNAEVISQWHSLFKGTVLTQRYLADENLSKAEIKAIQRKTDQWRERLISISWFMRCLNEPIAREANREDKVTGRFWEGRFKSQALLDEKALATCMAYVDLNPIRARMAKTPELSDHTSIKRRINQALATQQSNRCDQQPETLLPFAGNPRNNMPKGLPFRLTDYIELVEWSGRIMRSNKKGYIPEDTPDIVHRLGMKPKHFLYLTENFECPFKNLVGAAYKVREVCEQLGQHWVHGINQCEKYFSSQ